MRKEGSRRYCGDYIPSLPPDELEEVRGESEAWTAAIVTWSLMIYQ